MKTLIKNVHLVCLVIFSLSIISCSEDSEDSVSTPPVYEITLNSSLSSPIVSPVGVTVDDNGLFWIMAGVHNGGTHVLISWDPTTGSIPNSYSYDGLIEVLGTGVYGIAWDGSTIWISVSGMANKLVQVDPVTGNILQELSSPTVLGPSDLSWDGTNLWLASGTGEIYIINPINGSYTEFLNFSPERDSGITIRSNGEVWVGDLFDASVTIYDPTNSEKIDSIKNVFQNGGSGLAHSLTFYNGQLIAVHGDPFGGEKNVIDIYDISNFNSN